MRVIVTGASGQLGRLVAEEVLARMPASDLVLATRRPRAIADLANRGVEVRRADFDEPDTLRGAFANGERLLLISTPSIGRRVHQHRAAIEAAAAAGVRHVVYTSMVRPEPGNPIGPIADENRATERVLEASGLEWTILRFGSFAETQVAPGALAVTYGKLITNAGDGRIVPVSRADCAAAAAVVLTTDGHAGRTYDITGAEAFSQGDLARLLSEVTGSRIEVTRVRDRMLTFGLTRTGIPKPMARAIVAFGAAVREGCFDVVDPAFEELTGRPPRPFRDILIAHRGELVPAA
jgi:NAD(P)H dehydrogenase (quinone)